MTLSCLQHGNPPEIKLNFFRNCDLTEVTLFRAQALRVKRYSYWICVRRKRAGADGGFTTVQLHADKNRRAPHGHVADPAWPLLEGTCPTIPLTLTHCPQKNKKGMWRVGPKS